MKMATRIEALEGKGSSREWENYHQIVARDGQSIDDAIDEYGRGRIGPNDFVVVHELVAPRFDSAGNMIFWKDWPEDGMVPIHRERDIKKQRRRLAFA